MRCLFFRSCNNIFRNLTWTAVLPRARTQNVETQSEWEPRIVVDARLGRGRMEKLFGNPDLSLLLDHQYPWGSRRHRIMTSTNNNVVVGFGSRSPSFMYCGNGLKGRKALRRVEKSSYDTTHLLCVYMCACMSVWSTKKYNTMRNHFYHFVLQCALVYFMLVTYVRAYCDSSLHYF